jgi:hypothetical protein
MPKLRGRKTTRPKNISRPENQEFSPSSRVKRTSNHPQSYKNSLNTIREKEFQVPRAREGTQPGIESVGDL